ncbi:hypothetical protein CTA1_2591 [Colletotrichum tanaceti]|uniref:Uncharacterized protein n=1 Tax=Colletotrichum tanaceti TaxID=1306861 RepID=A0A4U6WZH2_9PEZI|nr:hypothetical protein CTA1_2591 [Colletotrichum tanaceti]
MHAATGRPGQRKASKEKVLLRGVSLHVRYRPSAGRDSDVIVYYPQITNINSY